MKHNYANHLSLMFFVSTLLLAFTSNVNAQTGYVRASGKNIVDQHGNNLILRGIGTGNWVLQEGYMMNTGDIAPTMWKFRELLTKNIGAEKTDEFYNKWYDLHFTKQDVDSMAHWGFNCVRVALHYKIFTLPIEEEPVSGENTWLKEGFDRLDNLYEWCAANKIYLVLDMHGCPGGQGTDAAISDYDPSKPSLWESEDNKSKLVALWRKLAERYSKSEWIGGYDLINETNWTKFTEPDNKPLRDLMIRITKAIREVDNNHILYIEGNGWANDFNGLTPKWDGNMAYSFHKYWNYNNPGDLDWVISLRNAQNCPIWLGETGENSNTWFTDIIELCESNNVGWSMWPVKKTGINNILTSSRNSDYDAMLDGWRSGNYIDSDRAYKGVMKFAEDHKFSNCKINYDVIDAMINRPFREGTKAFVNRSVSDIIYASDYDFGRNGDAYYDNDDVNYHLNTDTYVTWNKGYAYRNDGVDIESGCTDSKTNGYSVGYIEDGEWMQYTVISDALKAYSMVVRYASDNNNARAYITVNGKRASKTFNLSSTGGWKNWKSYSVNNIIIPEGEVKIRLVFEKAGANVNYMQFVAGKDVASAPFELLHTATDNVRNIIEMTLSKDVTNIESSEFNVKKNNIPCNIIKCDLDTNTPSVVKLYLKEDILPDDNLTISYAGTNCINDNSNLTHFSESGVANNTVYFCRINEKIEAESYIENFGFDFEKCTDEGDGQNSSYADKGDYLDYVIYTDREGIYSASFRVSVNNSSAMLRIHSVDIIDESTKFLSAVKLNGTGGWQNWNTSDTELYLNKGKNRIRVEAYTDGFNMNWWKINSFLSGTGTVESEVSTVSYYNDKIYFNNEVKRRYTIELFDIRGAKIRSDYTHDNYIEVGKLNKGVYIVTLTSDIKSLSRKIIIS